MSLAVPGFLFHEDDGRSDPPDGAGNHLRVREAVNAKHDIAVRLPQGGGDLAGGRAGANLDALGQRGRGDAGGENDENAGHQRLGPAAYWGSSLVALAA